MRNFWQKVLEAIPKHKSRRAISAHSVLSSITYPIISFGFNKNLPLLFDFCAASHILSFLVQICYVLGNPTRTPRSQHLATIAVTGYLTFSALVYSKVHKPGKHFYDKIRNFDPTQNGLERVMKFIKSERKIFNFLVLLVLAVWISSCLFLSPILSNLKDFFFYIEVFEHYFGSWSILFTIILLSTLYVLGYASTSLTFVLALLTKILCIKFCIINERLNSLLCLSNPKYNDRGQEEVYGHICSIVKEYLAVNNFLKTMLDENAVKMIWVIMPCGGLCLLCIYFQCLQFLKDEQYSMLIKSSVLLIYAIFVLWIICACGQQLTGEAERLLKVAIRCPWLSWNMKNRRALLLMLIMATRPVAVSVSIISLNYNLAMQLMRLSFSYALTLYQLNNS